MDTTDKPQKKRFEIKVDWKPVKVNQLGEGSYNSCNAKVEYYEKALVYSYRLYVKDRDNGDYYFTDEEGDTYRLEIAFEGRKKEHYVDYNSKKPTIKKEVRFVWSYY